jgi:hypothetical protein
MEKLYTLKNQEARMSPEEEKIIRYETLLTRCLRLLDYLCVTHDERKHRYLLTDIESKHRDINPAELSKKIQAEIGRG